MPLHVIDESPRIALRECFSDPCLDVMIFLNEVVLNHPDAISFAPGRPLETLFHVRTQVDAIGQFVTDCARRRGIADEMVWREIGQWQGRPYFILNVRTGELAASRILDGGIEPLPLS